MSLQTIQELWASFRSENKTDINTVIVAGYGNKETDNQAYLGAGLRPDSVFIVNTRGEMRPTLVDLRSKTNSL